MMLPRFSILALFSGSERKGTARYHLFARAVRSVITQIARLD